MVFYVIGNGFDLHYRLETSYALFKKYLMETNREIVRRVDDLFDRYGMADDPENIENWSTLEDMLAVFGYIDRGEIYDEALSNAEDDDERADYLDSPSWCVDYYTDYIDIFKKEFVNWIDTIDNTIVSDDYFKLSMDDYVLTFNYTNTIEANYDYTPENILHLHGTIGEELILGHNDPKRPDLYNPIWDEDSDYRTTKAMEAVDNVLISAANLYFKDSKTILRRNRTFFEHIDQCDKVVFLGLSCGEQDRLYVEEIVRRANYIEFYWHDKESLENILWIAKRTNPSVHVEPIFW